MGIARRDFFWHRQSHIPTRLYIVSSSCRRIFVDFSALSASIQTREPRCGKRQIQKARSTNINNLQVGSVGSINSKPNIDNRALNLANSHCNCHNCNLLQRDTDAGNLSLHEFFLKAHSLYQTLPSTGLSDALQVISRPFLGDRIWPNRAITIPI